MDKMNLTNNLSFLIIVNKYNNLSFYIYLICKII